MGQVELMMARGIVAAAATAAGGQTAGRSAVQIMAVRPRHRRRGSPYRLLTVAVAAMGLIVLLARLAGQDGRPTPAAYACQSGTLAGEVSHVRDGDTIEVRGVPIRLSGLAAPERNERGGPEATAAMRAPVFGRELRCELDGSRTHDRCAGVCYLNGADIAAMLVRQGLARDCPRFSGGRYAADEREAARTGATIRDSEGLPGYCRPR